MVNDTLREIIERKKEKDGSMKISTLKNEFEKNGNSWSTLKLGNLTSYLDKTAGFKVLKIGPGKHRVSLEGSVIESNDENKNEQSAESKNKTSDQTESQENESQENESQENESKEDESKEDESKEDESKEKESKKIAPEVKRKPVMKIPRSSGSSNHFNVEKEIEEMLKILKPMVDERNIVKFKVFFESDLTQNTLETPSATLKAAKKRGIVYFKPEILLQGMSDDVDIEVKRWEIEG